MWQAQITEVPDNVAENPNVRVTFFNDTEVFEKSYVLTNFDDRDALLAEMEREVSELNALQAKAADLQKEVGDLPVEVTDRMEVKHQESIRLAKEARLEAEAAG